jgi:LacI family transcriptional regulator
MTKTKNNTNPRGRPAARPGAAVAPVTLDQVAARAGVSPSTVSRILNGSAVVSELKRQNVSKAIADLGFVPNPVARGLAGGRTLSVGVITQAIDSPFYGGAMRGVEEELGRAGYNALFVSGHWDGAIEARCIDTLRARRVDGLIVFTGRLSDAVLRATAKSLPLVVTGRTLRAPRLYSLNFDNIVGARLATEHLLSLGHRRIAFVAGDPLHPDAQEREHGYRAALAAAGVAYDPALVVPGWFHEQSGQAAIEKLLSDGVRFSAVFAANDQMAAGAALALHQRGLRVPGDVSLVGFDDLPSSTFSIPPLTTVHQPMQELGRLAAQAVLDLLAGRAPTAQMQPPVLVARDSTAPLRSG